VTESRIHRAANLLGFMSEEEAARLLVETGLSPEDAFLAVRAAVVYVKET